MKLCIDCKHHRVIDEGFAFESHQCLVRNSPVTGKPEPIDCRYERAPASTGCRPEGLLWEAN